MDIYTMKLTSRGFDLTFTRPVDREAASQLTNYTLRHYYYDYYKKEPTEPVDTSIQLDVKDVPVSSISISGDGKTVSLTLPEVKAGYIYELKLNGIRSAKGRELENTLICYTVNRLLDDRSALSSQK